MSFNARGWCALLLVSAGVGAQTPDDYDALYSRCVDAAGPINNAVVQACSETASEHAKREINQRYRSIHARLSADNPDDAKRFEASQKAWLQYRNLHCDLAGAHIGSPMYDFCPMSLNAARASELRALDGE